MILLFPGLNQVSAVNSEWLTVGLLELKSKTKQETAEDTIMCWDGLPFNCIVFSTVHHLYLETLPVTLPTSEGKWVKRVARPGKEYYYCHLTRLDQNWTIMHYYV